MALTRAIATRPGRPTEHVDLTPAEESTRSAEEAAAADADAAARKADARVEIDRQAEAARLRFVTPGAAQQAVYLRKANQAERFKANPSANVNQYRLLAASIGIEVADTGDAQADMDAVADIVLAMGEAWETAAAAIEAQRLGAKAAIDALDDPPEPAAVQAILDGLSWPSAE